MGRFPQGWPRRTRAEPEGRDRLRGTHFTGSTGFEKGVSWSHRTLWQGECQSSQTVTSLPSTPHSEWKSEAGGAHSHRGLKSKWRVSKEPSSWMNANDLKGRDFFGVCFLGSHNRSSPLTDFPHPAMGRYLIAAPTIWKGPWMEAPHLPSCESHVWFSWKGSGASFSSPPGPAVQVTQRWQCLLFQDRCRTCWETACQASADGYCTAGGHYPWLGRLRQRLLSASPWSLRGRDRQQVMVTWGTVMGRAPPPTWAMAIEWCVNHFPDYKKRSLSLASLTPSLSPPSHWKTWNIEKKCFLFSRLTA